MYGAIEAGGTKFVCAIGNENLEIVEQVSFPTTTPIETMRLVKEFFDKYLDNLKSIGVGSFGPIDVNTTSETYGFITTTPKENWRNYNYLGTLKSYFNVPMALTTDVNAAAYGEYIKGYEKKISNIVYFTIGTGIGGGGILNGELIEGFSHPEMGHMKVVPHPKDTYKGNCPFHGNCLEGMAAGPAIEKRNGVKGQDLSEEDSFWEIEADYIAQCMYNTTLMLSPDVIVLGGGVMQQDHLVKKVRSQFEHMLKGYVQIPEIDRYIVTPKLGQQSGIIGGLALAEKALYKTSKNVQ